MNFFQRVYDIVKQIPPGKVTTYGTVATLAGNPRMSRQVGFALHSNPDPKTIPCHRVIHATGRLAAGFAFGGEHVQSQLLQNEGVTVTNGVVDLKEYLWVGN